MVVKITSKFELKRLCKVKYTKIIYLFYKIYIKYKQVLGAVAIARLGSPLQDELGTCDEVYRQEIGSEKVTIFRRETDNCKIGTIVLRGATNN